MTGEALGSLERASRLFLREWNEELDSWPAAADADGKRLGRADRATPRETKWVVDFGDSQCTLYRQIAGSPVTLALSWLPGDRELGLRWINLAWDARTRPKAPELYLQPGHARIGGQTFVPLQGDQGIGWGGIDRTMVDRLAVATAIRLEEGGRLLHEMPLPKAAGAARVLRRCHDTALREWGVDPVAFAALRKLPNPLGGGASFFSFSDYPPAALAANAAGEVIARLTIGPDGRVRDCVAAVSSGNEELDSTTCRIFRERGRFEPAVGPNGAPALAPFIARIGWRIP